MGKGDTPRRVDPARYAENAARAGVAAPKATPCPKCKSKSIRITYPPQATVVTCARCGHTISRRTR